MPIYEVMEFQHLDLIDERPFRLKPPANTPTADRKIEQLRDSREEQSYSLQFNSLKRDGIECSKVGNGIEMVKKTKQSSFPDNRPKAIDNIDQSRFWQRIERLARIEQSQGRKLIVDHLKASIRKVTNNAKWISSQVCRFMPQYTLHEEQHFLNVLSIMDALVPDNVMDRLTALECGLCILTAFTHDLGMALPQDEYKRLWDDSTGQGKHFAAYRGRFEEELRQLERWRRKSTNLSRKPKASSARPDATSDKRVEYVEGNILSCYLRDTHTENEYVARLRHWLHAIREETGDEGLFCYGNFDYQHALILIGISHGRDVVWLRHALNDDGDEDRFFQPVATGESANLAFPGLLLRLADVMDFDASRTPRILFKHFGIENDQSVLEWNKHLSVVGWRLEIDPERKQQPDLLYSAECQHPVHEKAIRTFKTWIDSELSGVQVELDAQRRHLPASKRDGYDIYLAREARLDVRPIRDPVTEKAKYIYHDLQFHLDQNEIQYLLMGESLYGDPGLCIRELLQNALDAVHLRELRLTMKQKGEPCESVNGQLLRPGWVRELNGCDEELHVTLDWGTEEVTGEQWLRVTDNGIGMTKEVITRYFTQIGKSYYKSPEFKQERAKMKAAGELPSPISTFGIGILSCFMIGERISVKTRAADNMHADATAFDVSISGAGSLFWFTQGTRKSQGTEVLVWLKKGVQIHHDPHRLMENIRIHYGYPKRPQSIEKPAGTDIKIEDDDVRKIDPVLVCASHLVWPRFPVIVRANDQELLRLDGDFHHAKLAPLKASILFLAIEDKWGVEESQVGTAVWKPFDWEDTDHDEATGSRIRVWFAQNDGASRTNTLPGNSSNQVDQKVKQHELAAFVESQIGGARELKLVNGMYVSDMSIVDDFIEVTYGVGTRIWVDLCGLAAPALTASRVQAIKPQYVEGWKTAIKGMFKRFLAAVEKHICKSDNDMLRNVAMGISLRSGSFHAILPKHELNLVEECRKSWGELNGSDQTRYWNARLKQFKAYRHKEWFGDRLLTVPSSRDSSSDSIVRANALVKSVRIDNFTEEVDTSDIDIDLDCFDESEINERRDLKELREERAKFTDSFAKAFPTFRTCLHSDVVQTTFDSNQGCNWPMLTLPRLHGRIGNSVLAAPAVVRFAFEGGSTTLALEDSRGRIPGLLTKRGYDLCFPMTAVPLGNLRRKCGEWRLQDKYRALGVAPFLLPALEGSWKEHAAALKKAFKTERIYALMPAFELWTKHFEDWTQVDLTNKNNLSILWDFAAGTTLWSHGVQDICDAEKIGKSAAVMLVNAQRTSKPTTKDDKPRTRRNK